MSHRPLNFSLQVEAQTLFDHCGRSILYGLWRKGLKHGHRSVLFIAFVAIVGAAIVKAYEWRRDVLTSGSIETEAMMIAISFTLGLRQLPPTTTAWHLYTVIIPRRTITGRLVRGRVWRRHDGRHWIYKKFIV
jgi:hypothetical protein